MRKQWPELDLLRGIAVIQMIVHHSLLTWFAGVESLANFVGTTLFWVSFAPALFFLTTGMGYGIQGTSSRSASGFGLYRKVGILLVADQFLHWNHGAWIGIDFLGFIGLSMLVVSWVRRAQHPLRCAMLGMLAIILVRFGVGPILQTVIPSESWRDIIDSLTGRSSIPNFSYPFFPWLVYPLAGYCIGFVAQQSFPSTRPEWQRLGLILFGLAVFGCGTAYACFLQDRTFTRWGTMSISYFLLVIGVIGIGLGLVLLLCRIRAIQPLVRAVSLRGVACLSFIPIHYLFIDWVLRTVSIPPRLSIVIASVLLLYTVTIIASKQLARLFDKIGALGWEGILWPAGSAVVLACGGCVIFLWDQAPAVATGLFALGQLTLCMFLVLPYPEFGRTHPKETAQR